MYEYTSVLKEGGKVLPIFNVNSLKMTWEKCDSGIYICIDNILTNLAN